MDSGKETNYGSPAARIPPKNANKHSNSSGDHYEQFDAPVSVIRRNTKPSFYPIHDAILQGFVEQIETTSQQSVQREPLQNSL
jgi:hypothetical protein